MKKRNNIGDVKQFTIENVLHKRVMAFKKANKEEPELDWKLKMIRSGIPREFWHIEFDNFLGNSDKLKLVKKYCKKINVARDEGFGFLLFGKNGVGKTSLIMLILKEALRNGYSAFYISLPRIFKQIYMSWEFPELATELRNIMASTDFLAIGELGKDYHRKDSMEFARAEFDCLFRERREECLPTLLDTNLSIEELADTYGGSLMSLFRSRLRFIKMVGPDYRKIVQREEWERMKL